MTPSSLCEFDFRRLGRRTIMTLSVGATLGDVFAQPPRVAQKYHSMIWQFCKCRRQLSMIKRLFVWHCLAFCGQAELYCDE
eukprot:6467313-Amphidinium_carterae.1